MGLTVLCLLLLLVVATAWWAHVRWSAFREAEAGREQAATLLVLQARSYASAKVPLTPESPSGFYPTLPEGG